MKSNFETLVRLAEEASEFRAELAAIMPAADPLHPTGRCRCAGEGTCRWCRARCLECGATRCQHPRPRRWKRGQKRNRRQRRTARARHALTVSEQVARKREASKNLELLAAQYAITRLRGESNRRLRRRIARFLSDIFGPAGRRQTNFRHVSVAVVPGGGLSVGYVADLEDVGR